ncbi:zinc ribbon domain-containing protein [Tsukamurella serpentis]
MPTYEFRCARCGTFDAVYRMSDLPDAATCSCGRSAARVMTAPRLGHGRSGAMRLLDATSATANRPDVVGAVPGRTASGDHRRFSGPTPGRSPAPPDPRHARLPRP